jgi:hypothetical protein
MANQPRGAHRGFVGLALAAAGMSMTAMACSDLNAPLYFSGPTVEAQGNDDPLPTQGLTLRFRQPTMQEQMQLDAERASKGYDMDIPWISRDKVHVEVSYKVTNLDMTNPGTFTVIVDGASEYVKYDTTITSMALMQGPNDPPVFLPLIATVPRMIDAGASFSGIVREDDFAEGEMDLDALGRWNDPDMMSPTFAGVLVSRSEVPPFKGMGLVPDYTKDANTGVITHDHPGRLVVPAMYEIDVRLKADTHMQVEYFVRVRDDDDRLKHNDSDPLYQPNPTLFQPPATM